jgi:hypothetical protein
MAHIFVQWLTRGLVRILEIIERGIKYLTDKICPVEVYDSPLDDLTFDDDCMMTHKDKDDPDE